MSCAGNKIGYQDVLCPVLEITVDIGGLISFAGNYCGYQEDLYPLLEITVDVRRT
jgi:hypothetical protein